jgi:hypothetical protein
MTPQKLTREKLDALRAEVQAGAGDWTVTALEIDGVPIDQYVPADEDEDQETSS